MISPIIRISFTGLREANISPCVYIVENGFVDGEVPVSVYDQVREKQWYN